jgi:Fuc2NAc and GlcNAc transferase
MMSPPVAAALAVLLAFAVGWAGSLAARRWLPRVGLVDQPNARSSHQHPRPRGGGLAIVAGVLTGMACAVVALPAPTPAAVALLATALMLAAVGFVDDRKPLPVWPRLLAQVVAAVALVAFTGGLDRLPLPPPADLPLPAAFGAALAVLWLVAVTNFFNFMDGIDGLAGGQAVLTLLAIAALGWSADGTLLALVAAAATVGFLILNWPPASLFLGDGGSGFLGFALAALPLLAPAVRHGEAVLVVGTSMALFLLDPLWTLLLRWRRGERLGEAHRDHLYQRLAAPGRPHGRVTVPLLAASAALTLVAVLAYRGALDPWWALALAAGGFLAEAVTAGVRSRSAIAAPNQNSRKASQKGAPSQVPSAKVAADRRRPPAGL